MTQGAVHLISHSHPSNAAPRSLTATTAGGRPSPSTTAIRSLLMVPGMFRVTTLPVLRENQRVSENPAVSNQRPAPPAKRQQPPKLDFPLAQSRSLHHRLPYAPLDGLRWTFRRAPRPRSPVKGGRTAAAFPAVSAACVAACCGSAIWRRFRGRSGRRLPSPLAKQPVG